MSAVSRRRRSIFAVDTSVRQLPRRMRRMIYTHVPSRGAGGVRNPSIADQPAPPRRVSWLPLKLFFFERLKVGDNSLRASATRVSIVRIL